MLVQAWTGHPSLLSVLHCPELAQKENKVVCKTLSIVACWGHLTPRVNRGGQGASLLQLAIPGWHLIPEVSGLGQPIKPPLDWLRMRAPCEKPGCHCQKQGWILGQKMLHRPLIPCVASWLSSAPPSPTQGPQTLPEHFSRIRLERAQNNSDCI